MKGGKKKIMNNNFQNHFTNKPFDSKILSELTKIGFPWNVFTSSLKYLYACEEHNSQSYSSSWYIILTNYQDKMQMYLLSICVWLECDVPVVVVCKLNTYHLWTVVIFEQRFYFLRIEHKMVLHLG